MSLVVHLIPDMQNGHFQYSRWQDEPQPCCHSYHQLMGTSPPFLPTYIPDLQVQVN